MEARFIENEEARALLVAFIKNHALPFVANIYEGGRRSDAQNRLQRLLCNEIASQWEGHDPEDVRAYCKLVFGIPILREASDEYRETYDRIIKPHTYENKLEMMKLPIDLPVTRIMTKEQKTEYLDKIYTHFTEKGFILTRPEDEPNEGRG